MQQQLKGEIHKGICDICGKPINEICFTPPSYLCEHIRRFITLDENGKVRTSFYGSGHKACVQKLWREELEKAVKAGWLIPKGNDEYEVNPKYR